MHLTITTLAVSDDAKHIKKYWTHTSTLRRKYPSTELAMLPIEPLDDPNNIVSIWSNVQAADIVVCLISEEFLATLDDLTDPAGNNLITDEIAAKRRDPQFKVIPVVLRQCSWDDGTVFARLQALPRYKPVQQMQVDDAWCEIVQGITGIMESLRKQYQQGTATQQQPQAISSQPKSTARIAPSFCRKCGDPLPTNASYCSCGSAVAVSQSASAFSPPVQRVVSMPAQTTTDAFILIYSSKDKAIAEECMKQLKAWGINMIDSLNITPGALLREVYKNQLQRAVGVVFLVSVDLINEMWGDERFSVQTQARMQTSQTMLADSYMVIIRPCYYDNLFVGGQQPQVIHSVDNKPITSSKRREESWFVLGQYLQAQLTK